jgi:hypothetical protein
MGYYQAMVALPITVVEAQAFISASKGCLTEEERLEAITMIANNPGCGDLIPGGGGIRKVRFAIGGRGKRGGARIVYYFHNERVPIFMLTVFAKTERIDLSRAELNVLADAAKRLAKTYGA